MASDIYLSPVALFHAMAPAWHGIFTRQMRYASERVESNSVVKGLGLHRDAVSSATHSLMNFEPEWDSLCTCHSSPDLLAMTSFLCSASYTTTKCVLAQVNFIPESLKGSIYAIYCDI